MQIPVEIKEAATSGYYNSSQLKQIPMSGRSQRHFLRIEHSSRQEVHECIVHSPLLQHHMASLKLSFSSCAQTGLCTGCEGSLFSQMSVSQHISVL